MSKKNPSPSVVETPDMVLFFTKDCVFSQHNSSCPFTIDGIQYNCAEQYMMAEKARLFNDNERLDKIMAETSPQKQKMWGRQVTPFNKEQWDRVAFDVVVKGNLAKFSQNEDALRVLLATRGKELVEAAPRDLIWGIGLGVNNPRAMDKKNWRGQNKLGQALMKVREELSSTEGGVRTSPKTSKREPSTPPGAPVKRHRQVGCEEEEDD